MQLYPQKDLCVFGLHSQQYWVKSIIQYHVVSNTLPSLPLKLKIFLCYCPSFSVLESCCRKNLNWLGKKNDVVCHRGFGQFLSDTVQNQRDPFIKINGSVHQLFQNPSSKSCFQKQTHFSYHTHDVLLQRWSQVGWSRWRRVLCHIV